VKRKRKEHHDEHMDETWLIPYADLLTLLLALFIILFASSQLDSKKYDQIMRSLSSAFTGGTNFFSPSATVPLDTEPKTKEQDEIKQNVAEAKLQQEIAELTRLKEQIDQYIRDNGLNTELETKLTEEMLMIRIRDHALFASGSANLKPEARKLALAISDMLTQYPKYQIEVAGHTDNIPIHTPEYPTNWDLSSGRALNFMKILLLNNRINPARFRSIGYGEYRPVDTNDTPEGRSKNRRVEVSIIRNLNEN
jgi:chemotaxis protein MotB